MLLEKSGQRERLGMPECFRRKREKEKFRKKKNREADTGGGHFSENLEDGEINLR